MTGLKKELKNILSFWTDNMLDSINGGFYGCITGQHVLHPHANKGAVLNARILWTFSAAYRILKDPKYLEIADRAFHYITTYFIDPVNGGVYWELDCKGQPVNTKKQTYAQGFALYGFSEYYRATHHPQALELAKQFFYLIENNKDQVYGGYFEAFTADWKPIEDMRLSTKDANEKKSQNTHLHILEPYTNLCRIWTNDQLVLAQKQLIELFLHKIKDQKNHHLQLFFDTNWDVKSTAISYGHDIEASWLLLEAAEVLGNPGLTDTIKPITLLIADVATEGVQNGSMLYEADGAHYDTDRHWWVQAEAVVGYMYAYKTSGNSVYQERALAIWSFIQDKLVDQEHGEWYWSYNMETGVNTIDDKAGFWKCPYHNSRMCMELIENFGIE